MDNIFEGKNILVTGGTGTIGKHIVKKLLQFRPKVIRVLSNDENGQYLMKQELPQNKNTCVRYLIGDIRDYIRLKRAIEEVNIVFHAAALKHIDICEYDPTEAIKTNIQGTQNLIMAAMEEKSIEKVIFISTDKAANPISVMGATKMLSEKMISWASFYRKDNKPIFSSVRFGNVINSRGSIIPLFKKQIKEGGPITITDKRMRRFFMSIDDAADLILKSTEVCRGGEIFVLKMPTVRILDLAEVTLEETERKLGIDCSEIEIKIIGTRRGEKIDEDLLTEEEVSRTVETENMFIILPHSALEDPFLMRPYSLLKRVNKIYSTRHEIPCSKDKIREIFKSDLEI